MEEHQNQNPVPTKTTVALSKTAIARLRNLMKYGDTYSSAVESLLDFYERYKDHVPEDRIGDSKK